MPKEKNKSLERSANQQLSHNHSRPLYDRKCRTPMLVPNQNKKKSKSKEKSTQRQKSKKNHFSSVKQVKQDLLLYHAPTVQQKKQLFKHKNRPISNLANARHARNIDHQLSNLNDSISRNQASYFNIPLNLNESYKNIKCDSTILKAIDEGKKLMKNNSFQKALKYFEQCLLRDRDNIQVLYLLGVCCFHLQMYEGAARHLTGVIIKQDHYRKNVYLFLAICYKKLNLFEDAILTLTKAITLYPKYYDAIILRSKILSKQKRYHDAIEDLNRCIKLDPQNLQAYISKADCLRSILDFSAAIKIYTEILNIHFSLEILLKRAITYIESSQIQSALVDLNEVISHNRTFSEAYLFKGIAFSKAKNYNDAILSYEQAIKFNSSKKATTKALYEISKLKIEKGDFYGASYNLQRASSLEVDLKVLEKMKIFTQGATFIMKKKYRQGIDNMNILMKKQHLNQQIKPLIYAFRAYGYFCQYKFVSAINDLKILQSLGNKLDDASYYNFQILEGIIQCQNNNFKAANKKFTRACQLRSNFSDPLIYQSICYICQYNRTIKKKDNSLLKKAMKFLQQALEKQQNYNTYYLTACIYYTLNDMENALANLQKAIDKSDDHVIKHFHLRALIRAMMGKYRDTLNDCNNMLSLMKDNKDKQSIDHDKLEQEKDILEVYLNRAKCYLLFDEKKKAFQDLQTYISCKPLDNEIHTVAGKLLFSIGACEDAVKAYNYSPNVDKNKVTLLERMKCYLVLKQLNLCLKDMQKLSEMGDTKIIYDYHCLASLKQASKGSDSHQQQAIRKIAALDTINIDSGYIFNKSDKLFYKGVYLFLLKKFQQAKKLFVQSKTLKKLKNQLVTLSERNQDLSFTQQQFENRIYCSEEIDYNIALCDLMLDNVEEAQTVLSQYSSFNKMFERNDSRQEIDITPFPSNNRLCSIFPQMQFQDKIKFKLSFCLPSIQPPEITFEIQPKIIQQISMSSTQARPDAPWIKRNNFGVVFTDDVVNLDVDICTEKSIKNNQEYGAAIKIQTQDNDIEMLQEKEVFDKKNIVKMLSLDYEVQQKLANIMKKKAANQKK